MKRDDLYYVEGVVVFRGFCKSKHDKEDKNRIAIITSPEATKKVREDMMKVYEENEVDEAWRSKWVTGDNDQLSLSSKYDIPIYNAGKRDNEASIYDVTLDSRVMVALNMTGNDGKIGIYPYAINVLEKAADFNPFEGV